MLYWNGSAWVKVAAGYNWQTLTFYNGVPAWTGTGTISDANTVVNPTTSKIWMDRNLGATRVATISTDHLAYGSLYQWGRGSDGHELITWTSGTTGASVNGTTTTTLSSTDRPGNGNFITINSGNYDWRSPKNDNLWQGVAGVNNPCPTGYRIPTETEWNAERLSWTGGNNATGAFASPLKLPMAGRRVSTGSFDEVGTYGYYWSSTVSGSSVRSLFFWSATTNMFTTYRAYGASVRCIKD
jgi:hypothetical protein